MTTRTVLLTGSSSGIGAGLRDALLEEGHTVVGVARRSQPKNAERFFPVAADLSQLQAIPGVITKILNDHSVDAVISNAGTPIFGGLEEVSAATIQASVEINLTSHLIVARCVLPSLRSRTSSDLVLMGSESALRGGAKGTLYCAAKFGMRGFAQALRQEASSQGVRVSLINPGLVDTPFFENQTFGPGPEPTHALQANDVAAVVLHVLKSPPQVVFDEINVSPLKHVLKFRRK